MNKMKEKFKKLTETERGKTAVKFSGYMVFLLFVIVLILISGAGKESYEDRDSKESIQSTEMTNEITYLDMQKKLYKGNYTFTYKIKGSVNVNYEGEKTEEKITGYKETEDSTIKYEIEDGKTYEVKLNSKTEYNDLYKDLDSSFFNFKNLFDSLNSKNTSMKKDDIQKEYSYKDIEGYDYTIIIKENNITNIKINNEKITYDLTFNY